MLVNECRKILRDKWFLVLIFLCLFLQIMYIYFSYCSSYNATLTKEEKNAYSVLYQKNKGNITEEKLNFLIKENKRLEALVLDRTYSTKYNPDTYTGYIFGDYCMIHFHLYTPVKRLYEYNIKANDIAKRAQDSKSFFEKENNTYQSKLNQKIAENFADRSITRFVELDGADSILENDILVVFLIVLLCFSGIHIWIDEKEIGMTDLIQTSVIGRNKIVATKLVAYEVICIGLVLLFAVVSLIFVNILYGGDYLSMPAYSVKKYEDTMMNCNVFTFFLVKNFLILIALSEIILVISIISLKSNRTVVAFVKLVIVLLVLIIIHSCNISSLEYLNPLTLLFNSSLFTRCDYINFLNNPINKSFAIALIQGGISILMYFAIMSGKRFGYDKK